MTERRFLDGADWQLSMAISPRSRQEERNQGLRTLIVHRLSDTSKAVARVSLRGHQVSVRCEPCQQWCRTPDDEFPLQWRCPACHRLYQMEFAVLEEVHDDE